MKLIDTMETFLSDESLRYLRAEDRDVIVFTMTGHDHRTTVAIRADEAARHLTVRADGGVIVPAEQRPAVALFLTMANYRLNIGGFQMDMRGGEVFFQTSLYALDDVSPQMMEPLVYAATGTYAQYHPGLMAVLYQDADPETAIALVEDRPDADQVSPEAVDQVFHGLMQSLEEPSLEDDIAS